VAAADALIDERGVHGAGIDRVLAAAGASKSQLYHYFADKDDLVREVIATRFQRVLDAQRPQLDDFHSWAGIRRWLDTFVRENETNGIPGCPLGTLANELSSRDEAARVDLAECFTTWSRSLAQGLDAMRARGQLLPRADPETLATAVIASLQGGLLLAKTHNDVEPLRVALDASYQYLRTFRAQPTPGLRSPTPAVG
jgi:TetR/AcrR family transcriptional repressor of nem operon